MLGKDFLLGPTSSLLCSFHCHPSHPNDISSQRHCVLSPRLSPVASHLHHLRPGDTPEAAISPLLLSVCVDQLNGSTRTSRGRGRRREVCPVASSTRCGWMVSHKRGDFSLTQATTFDFRLRSPFHYQLMRYLSK